MVLTADPSSTIGDTTRTIVVSGNGTDTLSYQLAPGLAQYVQSVLVNVDATAAADVQPTLKVKEQTGVVIAAKRQGEAITGGTAGSATWALRLDDEGLAHKFGKGAQDTYADLVGNPVPTNANTLMEWKHVAGPGQLDLSNPFQPAFKQAGIYAAEVIFRAVSGFDATVLAAPRIEASTAIGNVLQEVLWTLAGAWAGSVPILGLTGVWAFAKGDTITGQIITSPTSNPCTVAIFANLQRVT